VTFETDDNYSIRFKMKNTIRAALVFNYNNVILLKPSKHKQHFCKIPFGTQSYSWKW